MLRSPGNWAMKLAESLRLGNVVHGQRGRRQTLPQPHLFLRREVLGFFGKHSDLFGNAFLAFASQELRRGQAQGSAIAKFLLGFCQGLTGLVPSLVLDRQVDQRDPVSDLTGILFSRRFDQFLGFRDAVLGD